MTLEAVGKELGIPVSTVRYHGWAEDWGVRAKGVRRDPREQRKARRITAKLEREEAVMVVERTLEKAEDLEVLARKCLVADSARAKVMVSRLAIGLLNRLEDEESVPVRSAAQALGSLAPIFRLLYGWGHEPEIQSTKLARKGVDDVPTAAVNLALIATTPEQLAAMAKANGYRDGQWGAPATECDGLSMGPSAVAPEQPLVPTHGGPISEKEAPPLPVNQPVQPRRETTLSRPPPLSPQERRRQQLEELDRLRAEWRG